MVFIFQNKVQIRFIKFFWHILLKWCFFFPFFSLPTQWLYHIFLSFADHRQVRLCLFQNGLRHRITLYPPSRKVSFLFCFAFCVYVHVFTRPYTWSQYSWTLGSHLAGWKGLETKRRLFFVNLSSDIPKEKCFGGRKCDGSSSRAMMRSSHTKLRARVCFGLILSWNTIRAKTEKGHTKSVFFLMENYLFVAKSAGSYYSWFFRSVVSTRQLFLFRCLNTRNI